MTMLMVMTPKSRVGSIKLSYDLRWPLLADGKGRCDRIKGGTRLGSVLEWFNEDEWGVRRGTAIDEPYNLFDSFWSQREDVADMRFCRRWAEGRNETLNRQYMSSCFHIVEVMPVRCRTHDLSNYWNTWNFCYCCCCHCFDSQGGLGLGIGWCWRQDPWLLLSWWLGATSGGGRTSW